MWRAKVCKFGMSLACIVRTSSTSLQPRSALRLLERALDVLCLQWGGEHRHVDTKSTTQLHGSERVRLLKHIAYRTSAPFVPQQKAEEITKRQLMRLGWEKVEPRTATPSESGDSLKWESPQGSIVFLIESEKAGK
jgi:hypothetical protein